MRYRVAGDRTHNNALRQPTSHRSPEEGDERDDVLVLPPSATLILAHHGPTGRLECTATSAKAVGKYLIKTIDIQLTSKHTMAKE